MSLVLHYQKIEVGKTIKTNNMISLFRKNRFQVVDIQNATLSGGVAVGAIADLMLQPGGAFVMGSITGAISAFGYRILQVSISHPF